MSIIFETHFKNIQLYFFSILKLLCSAYLKLSSVKNALLLFRTDSTLLTQNCKEIRFCMSYDCFYGRLMALKKPIVKIYMVN